MHGELADQCGIGFYRAFECSTREPSKFAVADRANRRRARFTGEQRQLADAFAAADFANDFFAAVDTLDGYAQPARQHDVHRVAGGAGAKQDFAAGQMD